MPDHTFKYFSKVWQRLFQLFLFWLMMMFVIRLALLARAPIVGKELIGGSEYFAVFWMGLRFDILVLCFFAVPLLILSYFFAIFRAWNWGFEILAKFYLAGVWILICTISFVGGVHYLKVLQFLRLGSYYAIPKYLFEFTWTDAFTQSLNIKLWGFLCLVIFLIGLGFVRRLQFVPWNPSFNKMNVYEIVWRLLLPIFLVTLGARGTVTAHHLALEHSETVSEHRSLNELSLNALWAIDKK